MKLDIIPRKNWWPSATFAVDIHHVKEVTSCNINIEKREMILFHQYIQIFPSYL